ncbi:MAG TPA: phosphoribosylamine--glycine ligase, partial [Chitinophagaceae bacterium]|nr:phosphoribosylamine--glycine ligase [Chitinophagaceae bacterium]
QHKLPVVLKADGLAAGKGVVIAQHHEEALQCFEDMLQNSAFGAAGDKVVVEEFLTGIECSVFVLSDGTHYTILPVAKDYKRIGEGDTGLNTGGMGAVSPVPFADEAFMMKVRERIIEPTVQGLKNRKVVYKGFIFIGLISVDNEPYVIEYNCRMGDPETEVVMLRIENDLVDMLMSLRDEKLHSFSCIEKSQHAATVMLVSHGYPGSYEKGFPITLPALPAGSVMYHAGTTMGEGQLRTHGGRVLAVSTLAPDLESALKQSLQLAEGVQFEGKYFRRDIGWEFLPGNR